MMDWTDSREFDESSTTCASETAFSSFVAAANEAIKAHAITTELGEQSTESDQLPEVIRPR
jgi:hypothetical protein